MDSLRFVDQPAEDVGGSSVRGRNGISGGGGGMSMEDAMAGLMSMGKGGDSENAAEGWLPSFTGSTQPLDEVLLL
jgi:hypothetical protein